MKCLLVLVITCLVTIVRAEGPMDWEAARMHWSFQPPQAHALPLVQSRAWLAQPIDFFVSAELERVGRKPAATVERRKLIRRVTFDLTGLPPTAEEVEAFVNDKSTNAYERVIDRLLSSPRFGERMASAWLPLARFAEDQAHQVGSDTKFFYPNAHLYRAWIVDAFNRDLPYDRFVKLQIAADKLGAETTDFAALGFFGLGPKYYNRNRIEVMADEWEDRVDTMSRTFLGLTVACARCHDHKFEPVTQRDYYALAGVFASTKMVNRSPEGKDEAGIEAAKMNPLTVHAVEDATPQNLHVFIRGNVERKGDLVERRFLRVLSADEPKPFTEGSGRRELAEALASRENPLTARVFVNRIWAQLFGRGLVSTSSNFGRSGQLPTHPELLDDLTVRFMNGGWSVKSLVRELVLSSAYRQEHALPRRLTVEQWRDAALFVSGQLQQGGGPSQELDDAANRKRTLYSRVSRLKLNDLMMQFDYPDANVHAEQRSITTTPMQKLFMLNNEFVQGNAKALAARLTANPNESNAPRIHHAYRLLFAREPDLAETRVALEFLSRPTTAGLTRWEQYAQMLLVSNEMMYVD